jgi:DNA-binding CsgD family transcriptional regulator
VISTTSSSSPFVGRRAEIATLRGLVRDLAAGHGRAVWVEGEPGIGKSALLDKALSGAAEAGCSTAWAVADELSQRLPLQAVMSGLRSRRRTPDGGCDEISSLLREPLATGVLGGGDRVGPAIERLLALVDRWTAASPLLMVLDDVQWADDASLVAWHQLALAVHQVPLLLVAAGRPVPRREIVDKLRHSLLAHGAVLVPLGPLSDPEVGDLVTRLVGARPGPWLARTAAHASGNPLYVREIVDAMVRERQVHRGPATAEVERSRSTAPTSLGSAIARRLTFLSAPALATLSTAALLGSEFSVADLAVVLGRPPTELVPQLAEAEAAGVVTESEGGLAFRHALIREALYEQMPASLRAALHGHAARALAESGASVERCARQMLSVGGALDSWGVGWIADHADRLTNWSPEIAAELLSRAASHLGETDPRQWQVRLWLAQAQFRLGRNAEAEACARRVLRDSTDPVRTGEMRWILARVLFSGGRNDEALAVTDEALRQVDLPGRWRARLGGLRAMFLRSVLGDLDAAEAGAREALAGAEAGEDAFAIGYALCILWLVSSVRREHRTALAYVRRALEVLSADTDYPDLRAFALDLEVFTFQNLDRPADAEACLAEGQREAERTGDRRAALHLGAAVQHYWTGRWDDTLAELAAVAAEGPEISHYGLRERGPTLLYHGVLALVAVHRDNRDAAGLHLAAGFAEPIDTVSAWENADFLVAARALEAERSGDLALARTYLAAILDVRPGQMTLVHQWLPDLVRIALAGGDDATARAALTLCEAEAAREEVPARAAAALLRCDGLHRSDPEPLLEAARHYEQVSRPVERAQTLEDAAELLALQGQLVQARTALNDAVGSYASLGADWCLRRAETRLRPHGIRRGARGPRARATTGWEALSRTELAIAYLVGEGRSNPDIAAEMFLARGTVQCHVSRILTKLGVRSRVEIAREALKHPPDAAALSGYGEARGLRRPV